MTIADAQREMRFAHYGGAPGMLTCRGVADRWDGVYCYVS